jgi:hypothetical protein
MAIAGSPGLPCPLDRRQRRRIAPKFIGLPVKSVGLCVKVFQRASACPAGTV